MKKSIFKKIGGLFLGLAMGLGVAVGVTTGNKVSEAKAFSSPYTMTIDSSSSGSNNVHWTSSDVKSLTYDSITWSTSVTGTTSFTASKTYAQIGSKNNPATKVELSTKGFGGKKITSVAVTCYCMSNAGPTLTVKAGSTTFINASALTKGTNTRMPSTSGTSATLGSEDTVTITFNSSAKAAIAISKVEVSWEAAAEKLSTPTNLQANVTGSSATLSWNAVSNSSGYTLSVKKGDSDYGSPYEITAGTTTKTLTGLTAGSYSFTVVAKGNGSTYSNSDASSAKSFVVSEKLAAPTGLSAVPIGTTATISWNAVANASSYTLYVTDGEDYEETYSGLSSTSKQLTGLTTGYYAYTVKAIGNDSTYLDSDEADGDFEIAAIIKYAITFDNNGGSGSYIIEDQSSPYVLPEGTVFTAPANARFGSWSVGGVSYQPGASVSFSGPITVVANWIHSYSVSFTGSNYTHSTISSIEELSEETITLIAAPHYDLPADVTVTGANKVSYSNGSLKINNPSGNVTIDVQPVARASYGITVQGSGDYADNFTSSGDEIIYSKETATITIAPDTSTENDYYINIENINVSGATKDSYTNNVLTISNPTGAVTITVSPKLRTVTGIELTSSPSTKTYNIGDSFSINNWVVKQKYSDGTTGNENIVNQCDIVFDDNNPAAMFEEGSHTVKFVYNGMSTISTNITVNKVTHSGSITFTKTNITTGKLLIATKDSNNAWYYLPTASASNAGPVKTSLTMSNGLPEFASTVAASTYMWNFTVSNGKYTIKNDIGEYLYANSSNSGLRVGGTSDTWTATATTNGYKLQETNNSRFLGVWVDGSDWRPYTSANAANYKGTGENIVFYTRTETPGTHLYAGIVAELPAGAQYYVGQTVEKSDLVVTGYYDDGESFEVDSSDFEISGNVLSLGLNTITVTYQGKTSAIKVNALQRSGTLIDARIETSAGWKQNYFYDGEQLEWDFTNINLVAYYDDEHTVSVSLQGLVESEKVEVSPEYPTYETTSFTITGSYDDGEVEVDINEEYNTVDGITVTDRAISSLSSWNPSSKFSFTVYEEAKFDFDNIGSVNLVWNDGTPATGAQQIKPLIEDGRLEIGLFKYENYSDAASIDFEPEIVVDSNFTWSLDYNGYFMALSSPLTRTRKQVQFEVLATPDSCTAYINSTATAYDGSPSASKYYNNMSVTVSSTDSTDVKDLISVSEVDGSRLYASPNTSYFCIGGNASTGGSITLQVKSGYYVTSVSMVLFNGTDTAGQTFKVNNESFTYDTKSAEKNITAYTYSNSIKLESLARRTWVKNIFITMEKASAAAETYATRFNAANVCGTDDYTAAIGSVWAEQAAYYSHADIEVRNAIKNGVADQTGSTQLEQCLARYDAAVSKASLHGTTSTITDFMSRNPSNGARINPILALNEVDNSVWVISAVALVGSLAICGLLVYKKRKEI